MSLRGSVLLRTSVKLYWRAPVGSTVLGSGNRFSIALPIGLRRLSGMMLPGKQPAAPAVEQACPESGSRIRIGGALGFTLCEKLPCRSSAVGIVYLLSAVLCAFQSWSQEKKKKSRLRLLLKGTPGIMSGPPTVPPGFS